MKVVAVIPVHGRLPLLKLTIQRLIEKNGVSHVICAGNEKDAKQYALSVGCEWVDHNNKFLSDKWNATFRHAKYLNPDAILFVGSSDWLSDNWLDVMAPHLEDNAMVGVAGCNFADFTKKASRLVYWPGYASGAGGRAKERANEPIGIGRLISAKYLDSVNWQPLECGLNKSIDWSMYQMILKHGGKIKMVEDNTIHALSISCDLWPNKHQFEDHWGGLLPSIKFTFPDEFLDKHFPESLIFNQIVNAP